LLGSLKDIDSIIKDIFNRYQQILLKKPPFNKEDFYTSNQNRLAAGARGDNIRNFRLLNKTDKPKTIYIYDNGKLSAFLNLYS